MTTEKPIPEDFYDVPGWFESIVGFYADTQKKLEREALELPVTVLTAAIGNVIHIYGNFTGDVIKLFEQTVNPLFEPKEYHEEIYKTLKEGAVNENNPAIERLAESLLFIRNMFDRDKKMITEYFQDEIGKISEPAEVVMKEEKFAAIMSMITKVHVLQIVAMIKEM